MNGENKEKTSYANKMAHPKRQPIVTLPQVIILRRLMISKFSSPMRSHGMRTFRIYLGHLGEETNSLWVPLTVGKRLV